MSLCHKEFPFTYSSRKCCCGPIIDPGRQILQDKRQSSHQTFMNTKTQIFTSLITVGIRLAGYREYDVMAYRIHAMTSEAVNL